MSTTGVTINGHAYVWQTWSDGGVTLADAENPTAGNPTPVLNFRASEIEANVMAMRQVAVG